MTRQNLLFVLLILLLLSGVVYLYFRPDVPPADFSMVLTAEERTLDPALCTTLTGARIIRALFEGLTRLDSRTLQPRPAIARSWEISDNGLRYTFHLRPAHWSDGSPVTAGDFRYSWHRLLSPASTAEYDYMLFYLKNGEKYRKGMISDYNDVGVHAPDDSTLIVDLEEPTPYFLEITAFESLMPINRRCVETYGIRWTHPENMVTNGPFVMTFHQLNYKIRLEKSRTFWDTTRPHFNTIDLFVVEGLNSAFNMYETGGADLIDDFPNLIAPEILKRSDKLIAPTLGTYFYRFNTAQPPFHDARVRRAFCLAVDREAIVRHVTQGGEVAATSLVPPGIPGYSPAEAGLGFHPEQARALMTEAGFPAGKGFPAVELLYNTSENHKKIAEAVSRMLQKELGVQVTPVNVEWRVLLERLQRIDFQFCRSSWYGDYTDPNTFLDMFVTDGGNNRTHWSEAAYDSLLALTRTTTNPTSRMAFFQQAETLLLTESPVLPLYYYVTKFLVKPDIRGLHPNIRGFFHFADLYRN